MLTFEENNESSLEKVAVAVDAAKGDLTSLTTHWPNRYQRSYYPPRRRRLVRCAAMAQRKLQGIRDIVYHRKIFLTVRLYTSRN